MARKLGIRWTIGDVSERGFEALRLSVWGAYGIFGEQASYAVCVTHPTVLTSELDEQGLQVAALSRARRVHVVSLRDVSICSPFPPHLHELGRVGAHFCGLNCKQLNWEVDGRPAELLLEEHWQRHRAAVYARVDRAARGRSTETAEIRNSSDATRRNSGASRAPHS